MSAYTLALNTRRSHLLVTTPTHSYAMPYIGLAIQTPQMPTGQEQFVICSGGAPVVAVPFAASNLVGATWQDKLGDLVQNYLYLDVGRGTLPGTVVVSCIKQPDARSAHCQRRHHGD